ncbi:MAG TPA: ABC transporter substrate-binding protein [Limnochordia bacterium]|nr:ABC transporter substrate-binding protein [Limnochordia bacterium]
MRAKLIFAAVTAAGVLSALPAAADQITLTVGGWSCTNDAWQKNWCDLYKKFELAHPDIKVNAVNLKSTGGPQAGGEGLLVQIATGEVPDVAIMADTTLAQFAAAGALTDVTPLYQNGTLDPSAYWNAALNAVTYEGRYWGVPFVTDDRALYYNADLLSNAGYDAGPSTLDQLDAMAQKLTTKKADGSYNQFGFWPGSGNWYLWGWGWLFGGEYYNTETRKITANDPHIVDALRWEVSYVQRYQKSAGNFCKGTLGMNIDGSWSMTSLPTSCPGLKYGVVPVPPPAEGGQATWSGIWTMAIPAGAKHVKEAQELVAFMTSAESQAQFSEALTEIPTSRAAITAVAPGFIQKYGAAAKTFLDLTAVTHARPIIPTANDYWSALFDAEKAAMTLKKTPQQALDDLTQQMQVKLDAALKSN